ncbi:MAG TPA: hypothetical protein VE617_06180 [Propionibacteriaceae bacterium]|nr:hypothetical protein [Propionibacteriaceae bacterium]
MTSSATAALMTQADLREGLAQVVHAEEGLADSLRERLGAGTEAEGVGPDHPGAVGGDVAIGLTGSLRTRC